MKLCDRWSKVSLVPGDFHIGRLPRDHHVLQMMCLHLWIGGSGQHRGIRTAKSLGRVGEQLDLVARIEAAPPRLSCWCLLVKAKTPCTWFNGALPGTSLGWIGT